LWGRFLGLKFSYLDYTLDEEITNVEFLFRYEINKLEGSYMVN
jgi:hypothetical protein